MDSISFPGKNKGDSSSAAVPIVDNIASMCHTYSRLLAKGNMLAMLMVLLSFNLSMGQAVQLKGQVVGENGHNPLPFAPVEIFNLKTGTTANNDGFFDLQATPSPSGNDTIVFSYQGFKKRKVALSQFLKMENKTIELKEISVIQGKTIVPTQKYDVVRLGVLNKIPQSKQITNYYNNKIANFIENKKGKAGWVFSANFYIDEEGHPETPFRVRVFSVDKKTGGPGDDLLNTSVVVTASRQGWVTVDLKEYDVPFPVDGAFVAMEWVNSGDQYFYQKEMPKSNANKGKEKELRKFYGQVIGSVTGQANMLTWGIVLGGKWVPYKVFSNGYINAMINAEIAYPAE